MKCTMPGKGFVQMQNNDVYLSRFGDDIRALIDVHKYLAPKYGDTLNGELDLPYSVRNANDFVRHATGGEYTNIESFEKDAPAPTKQRVRELIDGYARTMGRMGVDFMGEVESFAMSDRLAQVFKSEVARSKGSSKLLGFIPWAFKFFGEWHRSIQQFEPARRLYAEAKMLQTEVRRVSDHVLSATMAKLAQFEKEHYLSGAIVNKYLGWFDGQRQGEENTARLRQAFLEDDRALEQMRNIVRNGQSGDADNDDVVFGEFTKLMGIFQRDYWNIVNYGVSDPKSIENYDPRKYADSLAGSLARIGDQMYSLLSKRRELARISGQPMTDAEQKYFDRFNPENESRFRLRLDNYVPSKHMLDGDEFTRLFDPAEGFMAMTSGFLEARGRAFADVDDFSELLKQNLLTFGFAMETVSSYSSAKAIGDAINADPEQRLMNTMPDLYNTLRHWSDGVVGYHERSRPDQGSAAMQFTRNILTSLHAIGGIMLANPGSSVTNYAGGYLGLFGQFGFKLRDYRKAYKNALSEQGSIESEIARAVEDFTGRQLSLPGRYGEFIERERTMNIPATSQNILVRASESLKGKAMKLADRATQNGLLGIVLPSNPQEWARLTIKQSEENLRNNAAPVLHDMLMHRLDVAGLEKLSPEQRADAISTAIAEAKFDTFYSLNNALLDPSRENKPFWAWATERYAETVPELMLGSALGMWYMFRQVASHNIRMLNDATMRSLDNLTNPALKGADRYAGAGGLGLLLVAMGMSIYDYFAGRVKGMPRMSALVNPNPAQELNVAALGSFAMFGPMFNLRMPEQVADAVADDLSRLAGGVLAGGMLDGVVKEYRGKLDRPLGSYFNVVDAVVKDFDLVFMTPFALMGNAPAETRGEFYAAKKELTGKLENAYPWLNAQNDYLTLVRKVYTSFVPTEGDASEVKHSDTTRAVLSLFGLSPSYNPGVFENSYQRGVTINYDRDYYDSYSRYRFNSLHEFQRSPFDRAMRQAAKYGRIYPSAYIDTP